MTRNTKAFTIIELMITLFVASIIMALATPSFLSMIEKSRIRTTTEDLVDLLRISRLTAVEQRNPVKVCGSSDQSTCDESWGTSIIAIKVGQNGAGDEILAKLNVNANVSVSKNNMNSSEIDFTSNGWIPGDPATFTICSTGDSRDYVNQVVIAMSGKVRKSSASDATNCPTL
ncbi:MAG: prepilin-type N-terminal cleavage/methylation domain-containing protein [Ketobacter sp.]|nr:prepilin-type N-terminal cleavage/methylation domain-containing protein [Ketobacter sp.]